MKTTTPRKNRKLLGITEFKLCVDSIQPRVRLDNIGIRQYRHERHDRRNANDVQKRHDENHPEQQVGLLPLLRVKEAQVLFG